MTKLPTARLCALDVVTVIVPPLSVEDEMFAAAGIEIVHVPLATATLCTAIVTWSPFRYECAVVVVMRTLPPPFDDDPTGTVTKFAPDTRLPSRSGCTICTPVSTTATIVVASPVSASHACGAR